MLIKSHAGHKEVKKSMIPKTKTFKSCPFSLCVWIESNLNCVDPKVGGSAS